MARTGDFPGNLEPTLSFTAGRRRSRFFAEENGPIHVRRTIHTAFLDAGRSSRDEVRLLDEHRASVALAGVRMARD